jgi:tRNA(Ile)-lysidine synthetase-like protein
MVSIGLRFKEIILGYQSLLRGRFCLLSYSGGVDSSVLLRLLLSLESGFFSSIHVLYFQHNLRGPESEKEEKFVRAQCLKYGVSLVVESLVLPQMGNLQEQARDLRQRGLRAHLNRLVCELGREGVILTAHHRDDVYENFLITIAQGRLDQRLVPLPVWDAKRNFLRPMLGFSKVEVLDYARQNGVLWVEDSSNQSTKYLRNHIRQRDLSPGVKAAIERTYELQAIDLTGEAGFYNELFLNCEVSGSEVCIPRGMLLGIQPELVLDFLRFVVERVFSKEFILISERGLLPILQKTLCWKLAPNSGYAQFVLAQTTNKKLGLRLTQEWIHIQKTEILPE